MKTYLNKKRIWVLSLNHNVNVELNTRRLKDIKSEYQKWAKDKSALKNLVKDKLIKNSLCV